MTLRGDSVSPDLDHAAEDEPERGPLRRCAVTREQAAKETLVRFVVGPGGTVVADLVNRLPGRGIWLSARRNVLDNPRARAAFARSARGPVTVPPDLAAIVEEGLRRRVAELLGLARRAGQAVCGFQKAREWIEKGRAGLVLQAADGSAEECHRVLSGRRDVPVANPLDAAALGVIFGRERVVHVAVAAGRLAGLLQNETSRLRDVTGTDVRADVGPDVTRGVIGAEAKG